MKIAGAEFSSDRRYRYVLWRIWDRAKPMVMYVGLNPSTADEFKDDPTMRRCAGFAKSWGYGGFYMTNLFAYRATFPEELRKQSDPVGPENDRWLLEIMSRVETVVFVWGVHGTLAGRDRTVVGMTSSAYCIGLSKDGHPRHPLYLKAGLSLVPYPINAG